jgi:hypothetical protein
MRAWVTVYCLAVAACVVSADQFIVGGNTVGYKGPFSAC